MQFQLIEGDDGVRVVGEHKHLANFVQECTEKTKSKLITTVESSIVKNARVRDLYYEERNQLIATSKDAGKAFPSLLSMKSTLYKHRNKVFPKITEDIDEIITKLQSGDPDDEYEPFRKTQDGQFQLYHSSIEIGDERVIIFGTVDDFQRLAKSERWFFDGTFTAQPQPFQQLFTIHCLHHAANEMLSCVYCLMTSKKQVVYEALLGRIKESCENLLESPSKLPLRYITCDFESGFIPAVNNTFKDNGITFVGCLFHFTQCCWRHIQSCGLQSEYNNDPAFQQMFRQFMSLALLPLDEVEPTAREMISNLPPQVSGFGSYFEKQWLINIPPSYWNVSDHEIRTNNALEGWHSHVNDKCRHRHFSMWRFVHFVQNEELNQRGDLTIIDRGEAVVQKNNKYKRIDNNIVKLQSRYKNGVITKEEYLHGICANLASRK